MTEKSVTRNTVRTRRAILDAATQCLLHKGVGLTIAEVAQDAGVSKSGLLHHFPSRDELLLEVLKDTQGQLREEVQSNLDLSENQPGKLLRAYVRTLCSGESGSLSLLNTSPFWAGLDGVSGTEELEREDLQWWMEQFLIDGLDPVLVRIVRSAAEGLAASLSHGEETLEDVRQAGEALLRLTFNQNWLS